MVKIHQHAFSSKCPETSPNGRADRRTDRRTCRKTVTVGRMNQRTHVQVERGYFRLRTDRRTDGQPQNLLPRRLKAQAWQNKTETRAFTYTVSAWVVNFYVSVQVVLLFRDTRRTEISIVQITFQNLAISSSILNVCPFRCQLYVWSICVQSS